MCILSFREEGRRKELPQVETLGGLRVRVTDKCVHIRESVL